MAIAFTSCGKGCDCTHCGAARISIAALPDAARGSTALAGGVRRPQSLGGPRAFADTMRQQIV
ncbi:hypothetical protein WS70_18545 [Burkholderia mayonis]|uniref:Uncharacterized protein n=1 Tax=Burkholderia mayonis TaxID=1385591 RepID=A0A1B4FJV7_9BURK|nr:hypothetical protein [Burkholderia mayonis]AOJ03908.1 hypothetical protein WS70_18545 [Burkholderia mayonis]KVE40543.1 hypothetical protein WS70_17225 [Burkholderia mayonis]